MIIPSYWAEARLQERLRGRQLTLRRFGWSELSAEAAQAHAEQRVKEAMAAARAGAKPARRDLKVAYGGVHGLPIREEVLERHGDLAVTRNAYGARCLNVPDVLFADVDFPDEAGSRLVVACGAVLVLLALLATWPRHSAWLSVGALFVALLMSSPMALAVHRFWQRRGPSPERTALRRFEAFVAAHPDWRLRVYRTPGGLRALALHRRFDPLEPAVDEFFRALRGDTVYGAMCKTQRCFRARVSPKPWRIGIEAHLRPRPGTWPLTAEGLVLRRAWVAAYEDRSVGFASCRLLVELGQAPVDARAAEVQALHDRWCRVDSGLPIA